MIHLYYGDGKGKSTSATGLAIRAAGRKKRVYFVRFMKTDDSGECFILKDIDNITLHPCTKDFGFTFDMNDEQREQAKEYYSNLLDKVMQSAELDMYDMLVLDEINIVYDADWIDRKKFIEFLLKYGNDMEIVLTGFYGHEELVEIADYVTEFRKIRHPYDKGVSARKGIEY